MKQPTVQDAMELRNKLGIKTHWLVVMAIMQKMWREYQEEYKTKIAYVVWNDAKTEGYVTFDNQVAYEARKGAGSNCFDIEGNQMKLAQAFCEVISSEQDCTITIQEIKV